MNNIKFIVLNKFRANQSETGFTLIELLMVVILVGILSAISLPQFLAQTSRARQTEAEITLGAINRAQQVYRLENSQFGTLNQLATTGNISVTATGDFYQFSATPDTSSPANIATAIATSNLGFTDEILDYETAIFMDGNGALYSVTCRADNPSVTPLADANPSVTNACVNGAEVR
ncbi:MAG: type IV pilin-like G/H family protein [Cyanobacteria bacterium J06621_8]